MSSPPVPAVDTLGRNYLAVACEHGHAAIVQLLVARGAAVNMADDLGLTALHISSREGLYVLFGSGAPPALRLVAPIPTH